MLLGLSGNIVRANNVKGGSCVHQPLFRSYCGRRYISGRQTRPLLQIKLDVAAQGSSFRKGNAKGRGWGESADMVRVSVIFVPDIQRRPNHDSWYDQLTFLYPLVESHPESGSLRVTTRPY